jgi:antitoxin component YwqK of YwqJK toxin-antitoxin module
MNKIIDKLNVRINPILLVLMLITIFLTACENKKKVEIKNNAGVVIESYFVQKNNPDVKVGISTKYYDDGKILETINYTDGKQNGERTTFFPSGKIMTKENIVNNVNDGLYITYNEDGSINQEGSYKDNKMDGVWKTYYQGQKNVLQYEAVFKDGGYHGLYKEYYPNGKLYAEGNKIQLNEDLDVYDGKVQVYDSLGNLDKILTYDKGKQISKEEK